MLPVQIYSFLHLVDIFFLFSQVHGLSQNLSEEDPIESIIESANLSEKFAEVLEELKQANAYDPLSDDQYKNLHHLLLDDQQEGANEDCEMLQTDFVIPNDPFSRME